MSFEAKVFGLILFGVGAFGLFGLVVTLIRIQGGVEWKLWKLAFRWGSGFAASTAIGWWLCHPILPAVWQYLFGP